MARTGVNITLANHVGTITVASLDRETLGIGNTKRCVNEVVYEVTLYNCVIVDEYVYEMDSVKIVCVVYVSEWKVNI